MISDTDVRDVAGQALYEERLKMLPGLGQPPAPGWNQLEEAVRERWRGNAEASSAGSNPAEVTRPSRLGRSGEPGASGSGRTARRREPVSERS